MFSDLPQLVPQKICLSCQGCCRFREALSLWRPKMTALEIAQISNAADKKAIQGAVAKDGYVATVPAQGQHRCTFLNLSDNKCGIYACRPFECRLYPFLLTKKDGHIAVSVHGNCPYVQESRHSPEFERHIGILKSYLGQEEKLCFLKNNSALIGDYSEYAQEMEELFTLGDERPFGAALLTKKELVEQYLYLTPRQLSGFSFVNIFAWQEFFQFDFEVINGNLCVFARNDLGVFLYLPPLGKEINVNTVRTCFERMEKINGGNGMSRIENVPAHQLPSFPPDEFSYYKKGYEYCYYRKDIAHLTGNRYKSKRSSCNHFLKNNTFCYLPYEDTMLEACGNLYQEWAKTRRQVYASNPIYVQMLEENAQAHRLVLRHHRELGLIGRVVKVAGKIKAYSFGYPLNKDIFCVLFEIADLSINGLAVFMFKEFCRDEAVVAHSFINVMDDFELTNIQQTKMSFRPTLMLASYTICPSRA